MNDAGRWLVSMGVSWVSAWRVRALHRLRPTGHPQRRPSARHLIMGFGATSPEGPWHITQTAPSNGWTPTWTSLDVPPGTTVVTSYALATRHEGGLELFAVSVTGAPGHESYQL